MTNFTRRSALGALLASGAGMAWAAYPDKPIKLIVSTTPGSSPDTIARLLGHGLAENLGQPVVVENRGGANGMIAVEQVARAAPDGYTLLLTTGATFSTNPALYPRAGGRQITSLVPITQVATTDFVLAANPASNVKTLADFLARARAEPGKLNVATTAKGSFAHLIAELLKQQARVDFLPVTYNGGGPAMTAFVGNQTEFIIEVATLLAPMIKAGKAIPLATTGDRRSIVVPDLPTVTEAGIADVNVSGWFGLAAPPDTPASIVEQIHASVTAVLTRDDVKVRLAGLSAVPVASTPAQFGAVLARERAKWQQVIAAAKIDLE